MTPERCDLILLTHGHGDHVGDTVAIHQRHECPVVAQVELRGWLSGQGVAENPGHARQQGRTRSPVDGVKVDAHRRESLVEHPTTAPMPASPAAWSSRLEDGFKVYFAGDTNVFGDMSLIARIYAPDVAVLPIGDHYTMGPREASVALELLGVTRCVPCHYGTFSLLTGTPEALRELVRPGVEILAPDPGETLTL